MLRILSVLFFLLNGTANATTVNSISCEEVTLNSPSYDYHKIEEIALKANLEELNRYHESVISWLCKGTPSDINEIDSFITADYIGAKDVSAIAKILGKNYTAPKQISKNKQSTNTAGNFQACYLRSMSKQESEIETTAKCIHEGIDWCNEQGIKTSHAVEISSITHRFLIENPSCASNLSDMYNATLPIYDAEFQNYSRSEAAGLPYTPIFFDIRDFAGAE